MDLVTIDDGQKKEAKKKKTCTKTDTSGSFFFLNIIFQHLKEAFSFFNWDENNDPGIRVEAGDYSATRDQGPLLLNNLKSMPYILHLPTQF